MRSGSWLDPVDLDHHLEQLRIARASKARALEELQSLRRTQPVGPVRLSSGPASGAKIPILSTQQFRRFLQLERIGAGHEGPRRFVWQPANQREADELMRLFNVPATKSAGSRVRGFSVERFR
jgi:hypothetical protein